MLSILFFHPSLWSNTIMRKAYVVSQTNSASASAIRVKLTTYKPARPVTLARFHGMPTTVSLAMRLNQRYSPYSL